MQLDTFTANHLAAWAMDRNDAETGADVISAITSYLAGLDNENPIAEGLSWVEIARRAEIGNQ